MFSLVFKRYHFSKYLLAIYLFLSIYLICIGTQCIITNESPVYLETFSTLWDGFINSISSHLILITGALTLTNGIWILTGEKNS